ncbi:SPOR domain-containing protein [Streptomyces litchfieldiae]|uniref:SPOR domain-containing protein n=1 Tax=Streptomyces litchfieldiae TaxID=3075543 RepID=A0ABU2MLW1_9ACTN|nr:SPOR domain-containing protein [Streptomyces sp. DSM 44938]MDT0342480.1 SPOR domain-containing protein [Streptomyces sp. DSM 44938]
MNGSTLQPWQVVREDENGGRYRIGHCATRAEAQRLIQRLRLSGGQESANGTVHYLVERVEVGGGAHR